MSVIREGGTPMARTDNYLIQAQQAKSCFLTYDADGLMKNCDSLGH